MLRVDCQSHVFAPAYAELLTRNPALPRAHGEDGRYVITYGEAYQVALDLKQYGVEAKLKAMDQAGIDVSVLSMNMPGPDLLAEELAVEGARICNDYLAEVCARHPERFVGLASLPLQSVPAAIAELDRAMDELGLRGAILYSHLGGQPVDAPELEPFYQHVAERGVPLVLHPTVPTWAGAIQDHAMVPMLGFVVDTSIAMLRLILGGILERYPRLQLVHPHAGGVLPYIMGRIVEQTEIKGRGREHITRSPEAYYRRVYLDTVSPSPLALRYAYDFAGSERLLFGTDHPWAGMATMLDLLERLDIPTDEKTRLFGENARGLFGL